MTPRADRPFLSTLRKVERQLGLPIPARLRILMELESDLEGLRGQLEAEGIGAEDAQARSVDVLAPDPHTIRELGRLYAPRYRQVMSHLAQDRVRLLERLALAILTVSVLVAETLTLLRADLLRDPSPFLWLVLCLGALLFAIGIGEGFAIWVKGDHRLTHHGSQAVLVTAGATLTAGLLEALVDGYRLLGNLEGEGVLLRSLLFQWLEREVGLLAVSLVLALAGGLAWFILSQWLTTVSGARRDVLGLGPTATTL